MIIALDSNVFIAALFSNEDHSPDAQLLMREVSRGNYKAVASSIIYSEVLELSRGSGLESDVAEFISLLENLYTLPAGDDVCKKAGELRLKHGSKLKLPDALHLASAIVSKADVFVTNDKRLFKIAGKLIPAKLLANWV